MLLICFYIIALLPSLFKMSQRSCHICLFSSSTCEGGLFVVFHQGSNLFVVASSFCLSLPLELIVDSHC